MTNVMTNAWTIARKGQKNFGGKVKEYFSQALRMAWAIFKKGAKKMNGVKGIIRDFSLPELQGSDKQVAWAMQIRNKAAGTLKHEVTYEDFVVEGLTPNSKTTTQKRNISSVIDALLSKEGIQAHLDEMKNLPESRIKSTIKCMNNALDRHERMVEIATNPSAKFWIDNRDNQDKNYMFNKFAKYVQTGVKEF